MKKRNWIISIILGASIITIGTARVANARGEWDGEFYGFHRGDKIMYLMRKLDLSKVQRQVIRSIKNETREQMVAKRDEIHDMRRIMFELANSDAYDTDKVRELASAISPIRVEIIVQRLETMNRIRKELTPEQVAKMDDFLSTRIRRDDF
ncbi:MAG: periplasmic heavy metal sensor [Methylomarinum sp.]|nr:periplasmic heavy metal sensor [Methylomarinum sp.]